MRVLLAFGTRPEAIKMCPLIIEMKARSEFEVIVCLTGQHEEMLNQVMNVFNITEDYNLRIMKQGQSLSDITTSVLLGIENIIKTERPDCIIVHGDTTTAFSAGLSAYYNGIPVCHVEAGLRTFDVFSPYPEEFNRQAIDIVSDLYFAPTESAKKQLIKEGKKEDCVIVTGNTVIDALKTTIQADYASDDLEWASGSRMILLTTHRRENIGGVMVSVFSAINRIVEKFDDVKVLFPIHLNPIIRELANKYLNESDRVRIIEPLNVIDFHNYMNSSYLIVTDSGGIQEEAPSLNKPVLVVRNTTERPEGIEAGVIKLVGTDEEKIFAGISNLLNDFDAYRSMCSGINPYGDGFASKRIADFLIKHFSNKKE